MTRSARDFGLVLTVLAMLALFAVKDLLVMPGQPPARVEAGAFDTHRALGRLARILGDQRPHPVDTAANDAVRGRLIAELRAIGLNPQVHEASDCRAHPRARTVSCSHVRNILASIGPVQGPRLLLNAHYDSTPTGPGASDDGIGVATLLEVASLMRATPPKRPVTFLFNEGEEYGLNGASAFAASDPLAREVDSLINIESRGVSGPATMFETSTPNGPAIADYANATRRPSANSISTDMATLIPNTTDVEEWKPLGWKTLSYAIIGNETRYHSPGDTVASLDRASLNQMGNEVLAATRVMAASPRAGTGSRMVFTDVAGLFLFRLPLVVAALLLGGLLVGALWLCQTRRAFGRPLLACTGAWIAGTAAAALAAVLLGLVRPGDYWRAQPVIVYLAIYAVTLASGAALLVKLAAGVDRDRLRTAAWGFVLLLGSIASLVLPGATIFFLVAPALALAGLRLRSVKLLWLAAIVQLLMVAQLLALIEMLLVTGPLWAVAPLAAMAALPVMVEVIEGANRKSVAALGAIAITLCAVALLVPRTSASRAGRLSVDYLRDDVANRADWSASNGLAPLPADWSRFGPWTVATLRNTKTKRWLAKAPLLPLPTATLSVKSIAASGNGRRIILSLDRAGFDAIGLRFAEGVPVTAIGLAGRPKLIPTKAEKGATLIRCAGRSCDRMLFEVRLSGTTPVDAELIGTRYALPVEGAALVATRPDDRIPQYAPNSSVRIVPVRL